MKKIASFALISSLVLSSTTAFAGGMVDPIVEPAPVVVEENTSSSATPLWAIIGGAIVVAALVSNGDSNDGTNGTNTGSLD
ncbi:hypothetical protein GCM10010873_04930 [Cypionkella aquatica]|uniref:Ferrochelatase n=1 Tax=Cypionkella aquatica TaxID=1756042 RepID=A0AA37X0A8_9RHOB|nr:hypothetical protein [Cypionkella aquatica]GLS85520.1 hypothetical protein GCM10010873_04930 [Cypionkella aquatica]